MDTQDLIVYKKNGIGHIILNRPSALNAINLPMVRGMYRHLNEWANDADIKIVVVTGSGEKAFCAGGDIRTLYESMQDGRTDHLAFFEEEFVLNEYIYTYPKPYIALLDGYVMGGGMGISQGASYRIATERTKLSMPETAIGYFPDVGGSYFLSRCPDSIGVYLGLTGKSIQADDALFSNLVDWIITSDRLEDFTNDLETINFSQSIPNQIDALLRGHGAVNQPRNASFSATSQNIKNCFSLKAIEEITQELENLERVSGAQWVTDALVKMAKNSPLALAATLKMINIGQSLTLSQCFAMELILAKRWMDIGDFVEGIRALIIDKDNLPKWRYQQSELSTEKMVFLFPELYLQ